MFQQARSDVILDIQAIDQATNGHYSTTVAHFKRNLELLQEQGVQVGDIDQAVRNAVDPHYQVLLVYGVPTDVAEQAIQTLIDKESQLLDAPEQVKEAE
jgi:hypothetical protein